MSGKQKKSIIKNQLTNSIDESKLVDRKDIEYFDKSKTDLNYIRFKNIKRTNNSLNKKTNNNKSKSTV